MKWNAHVEAIEFERPEMVGNALPDSSRVRHACDGFMGYIRRPLSSGTRRHFGSFVEPAVAFSNQGNA